MCDTFVILSPGGADREVLFGKNSDREPNEAQALEYHPAATHPSGATVRCTYLEIPQARETRAVLICRPFWMWGAEMGANDRGLVIGNEAVFTRMPFNRKTGLTGMDLVRLALERADDSTGALEVMVGLLSDHGQGGVCGYQSKGLTYHNSFLLADPREAWVLETAGHLWAALRVKNHQAISNRLTIGEEVDEAHPDVIDFARRKGWLPKGRTFDFAAAYSDWFYSTFAAGARRRSRALDLIEQLPPKPSIGSVFGILRDHADESYHPDSHLLGDRLCAHAANRLTRHAFQTTGSLAASLTPDDRTFWATGSSAPCLNVFKPVWFEGGVLPDLGPAPTGTYDPACFWWRREKLHRLVLQDFIFRSEVIKNERDALERSLAGLAEETPDGRRQAVSEAAFRLDREAVDRWTERLEDLPIRQTAGFIYRRYWSGQNRKAGL